MNLTQTKSWRSRRLEREAAALANLQNLYTAAEYPSVVDAVDTSRASIDTRYGIAQMMSIKARAQSQMREDAAAEATLDQIPARVADDHPDVGAYLHLVRGQLRRRKAHTQLKSGDTSDRDLVEEASAEFRAATLCALRSGRVRPANIARLNDLYTAGLSALTSGELRERNPELLVQGIPIELAAQLQTPPAEAVDIQGLVILGDLAYGANLGLSEIFRLSVAGQYQSACRTLFNSPQTQWSQVLLRAAKSDVRLPALQRQRALVLGSRFLLREFAKPPADVVDAYLAELASLVISTPTLAHEPRGLTGPVAPGLHEQVDALRPFAGPLFRDRRQVTRTMFR